VRIAICDVGPRDGLQNAPRLLTPSVRAELVDRLAGAGLPQVEVASFVDARRVPTMAGAEDVAAAIERQPNVTYAGLVLNERGYERFRTTNLDEVHLALAATETFNARNQRLTVDESVAQAARVIERAHADGRRATATIAVAFGCPFEGRVDPARVVGVAEQLIASGADAVVLADTIGVAVPRQVRALVDEVGRLGAPIGMHLHNTRNTGIANAIAAIEGGVLMLDASVGGIGGCPFAPGASGNIATEDLVYVLHGEGIETGVSLEALLGTSAWLEEILGQPLESQVHRAGDFAPSTI
jgi:isopropylmalate/homocitrate/citramalate synthase